jgi:hypothetical protein
MDRPNTYLRYSVLPGNIKKIFLLRQGEGTGGGGGAVLEAKFHEPTWDTLFA